MFHPRAVGVIRLIWRWFPKRYINQMKWIVVVFVVDCRGKNCWGKSTLKEFYFLCSQFFNTFARDLLLFARVYFLFYCVFIFNHIRLLFVMRIYLIISFFVAFVPPFFYHRVRLNLSTEIFAASPNMQHAFPIIKKNKMVQNIFKFRFVLFNKLFHLTNGYICCCARVIVHWVSEVFIAYSSSSWPVSVSWWRVYSRLVVLHTLQRGQIDSRLCPYLVYCAIL